MRTTIPLAAIVEGQNYRKVINPGHLAEMQASIKERGLLQNLGVEDLGEGRYRLRWGFTRLRAIQNLEAEGALPEDLKNGVPVLVGEYEDEVDALLASHAENIHQRPHPMDEALLFAQIRELDGRQATDRIARATNLSMRTIQQRYQLAELPEVLQQAARAGELSIADARRVIKLPKFVVQRFLDEGEEGVRSLVGSIDFDWYLKSAAMAFEGVEELPEEVSGFYEGRKWKGLAFDKDKFETAVRRWQEAKLELEGGAGGESDGQAAAKLKSPPMTKAHLVTARRIRAQYLQEQVAKNHETALRVLVLFLQQGRGLAVFGETRVLYSETLKNAADANWPEECCRQYDEGAWRIHVPASRPEEVWDILTAEMSTIRKLVSLQVASLVQNSSPTWEPGIREDAPEVLMLAEFLGVERVEDFELTEAYLQGYRKHGLVEFAKQAGAISKSELGSFSKLKASDMIQRILSSETRARDFVPEELTFPRAQRSKGSD